MTYNCDVWIQHQERWVTMVTADWSVAKACRDMWLRMGYRSVLSEG